MVLPAGLALHDFICRGDFGSFSAGRLIFLHLLARNLFFGRRALGILCRPSKLPSRLSESKISGCFWYTIKFTVIAVISINVTALALALMVTKISRLSGIFRTIFFLPNMLGGLALGFIWQFIFQIVFSQILFGPESLLPIPFLQNMTQDNTKALFALAILVTWQMAGYMMIIYITGLNNIPYDLYEAAEIDGASTFQRFRVITLPMLMPAFTVVFF